MTDDPATWWDEAYEGDPPWENGRPQPALVDLVEAGALDGRILDAGCGAGTHACYLAARGRSVVGVDVSERAVERARPTARKRDLDATFRVGDALDLDPDLGPFDAAFDCGLFHALDPVQRDAYAQ
ncbi:class I SAM-dependent methyltransferase [Halorussus marinus]|uniref:class I SAM-dependent methyltransferase n=1 Tax=Halorussus marinus TaxID=2505976 RepID=UPI001ADA5E8A|nr:class I SAM-dependent methyltransferase [Halorussus marinus]